jgi:type IV pilus assembly protein PilV
MNSYDKRIPGPTAQSGFTMIEVLVAALVLAIGLLGLAGLQSASLRNNHSAYLRSQATLLAYGIADRMRANQAQSVNGSGYKMSSYSIPAARTACLSGGCSTADMAQNDLHDWETTLNRELPNGKGIVCIDSSPNDGTTAAPACDGSGNVYAIKIWWSDDRDATLPPKLFATAFRP